MEVGAQSQSVQRCQPAVLVVVTVACAQSDPGITTAVKSQFAADDTVKAYQIDVDRKSVV